MRNSRRKTSYYQSLLGAVSVVGLLSIGQVSFAQEAETIATNNATDASIEGEETKKLDTIVVTGFRQSLTSALNAKRNSGNVTDGINAEDIGKSADANIADALQRITGIAIEREQGEGSTVTVRGTSGNLNNVSINGVTVTSTSGDVAAGTANQAVDFSNFSSDLLSRIEIVKTPSADLDEGSLGAAINLSSFRPLGVRKDRRIIEVQGRYNEFSDDNGFGLHDILGGDARFNASFSEKLLDDTLGVSLVATQEKNSGRSDTFRIPRYFGQTAGGRYTGPSRLANPTEIPGGFTNGKTGELEQGVRVHVPFEVEYEQVYFDTKRDSATGTIQWKPTDTTEILFDATYSELQRKRDIYQFAVRPNGSFQEGFSNIYDPDTLTLTNFRRSANDFGLQPNGIPLQENSALRNPGFVRPEQNIEDTTEKNLIVGLDMDQTWGEFDFSLSGGHSRSISEDDNFLQMTGQIENQHRPDRIVGGALQVNTYPNSMNSADGRQGFYSGYDCLNGIGSVCQIAVADTVTGRDSDLAIVDDPSEFGFGSLNRRDRGIDDRSTNVFFDVDWNHRIGPISSLETGLKYSLRNRIQRQQNVNITRFGFPSLERQDLTPFVLEGQTAFRDGFGKALGLARDNITDGMFVFDTEAVLRVAALDDAGILRVNSPLTNYRDVKNEVFGGYLQANFDFLDERLQGDIGIRYVQTDVEAEGGASVTLNPNALAVDARNLAYFGYLGVGNPGNTATEAQATDAAIAYFGANLSQTGNVIVPAVPVSNTHSYDNFLPALNLSYGVRDDMIVRFGASRTIARPEIDFQRPNFSYDEQVFNVFSAGNGGNTRLNPYVSDNLDLSFEWYFKEGSLFSLAFFNKDLKDFVRETNNQFYIRELRNIFYDANLEAIQDPAQFGTGIGQPGFAVNADALLLALTPENQPAGCFPNREFDLNSPVGPFGCEQVDFRKPVNGTSGFVRGVEMSLQHNFDYLPGELAGLGFSANYTYSDSETEEETIVNAQGETEVLFRAAPLPNTSLHTFNATVFYEKDGRLVRLAYNTRSDFLRSSAPETGGYQHYGEGGESLDLSGGLDLTDHLSLNFQAVNLTDNVRRDYSVNNNDISLPEEALSLQDVASERTLLLQNTGRIFRIGLRYEF